MVTFLHASSDRPLASTWKASDGDQEASKPASSEDALVLVNQPGEGYRVILFNDEVHTFEQVVYQVMLAIRCPQSWALEITLRAHNNGRAVVTITDRTEADRVASVLRQIALRVAVEPV